MPVITDDFMREMRARARPYSLVLLKKTPRLQEPGADAIIWEHGRRNYSLREDGVLAIVCPVADGSEWAGVGIFTTPPGETESILDGDPAVQAGLLSYEVHPVVSFPGDSLPAGR